MDLILKNYLNNGIYTMKKRNQKMTGLVKMK